MDPNSNEDAEACLAIVDNSEVIIEDSSDISNGVIVEECIVEIQSSEIEYCPPYVEQTIELDAEEEIEETEECADTTMREEEVYQENEELDTEELLIPTAECEVEIEQDYGVECVYIKEEDDEMIEIHEHNLDDDDSISNDHYYCNLCEIAFSNEIVLRNHMMQHTAVANVSIKSFKCAVCKLLFVDTKSLAAHMIKEHPDYGNFYACGLCDKTFKRKFNLDYHLLQHCKPKSTMFQCNSCCKLFATKNALHNHMLTHGSGATTSGERVECNICHKTFQKSYLRIHMSSHTNNTEYSCHFCHKHLSSKQSLYMHMNTVHANEGCYECSYCEKRFFWKSYLDRHITVHTKEKSHHCNLCSKAFTRKLALRKHMTTHMGASKEKFDEKFVNFAV